MTGWLKSLFGNKPKPKSQKAAAKTASDRAALLAEAMSLRERGQANVKDTLEKTFAELKANPPKPSDIAGMTRLLNLRQAVLNMRANAGAPKKAPPSRPKR